MYYCNNNNLSTVDQYFPPKAYQIIKKISVSLIIKICSFIELYDRICQREWSYVNVTDDCMS